MRKSERHERIRERAAEAIRDLYHNATPSYPRCDTEESEEFQAWFEGTAQFEIEYIQGGGAYCDNPTDSTADFLASKYKSEKAQRLARKYYTDKKNRERARCNRLDSREAQTDALWERITDYGTLYQFGRGGRTLAPDDLIKNAGGFGWGPIEDIGEDMAISDCVELIQIVESFNAYVSIWCKSIPEQWEEEKKERVCCES